MARLSGTILSDDESFKAQLGTLLRLSSVPVLVADGGNPDIAVVDGRGDVSAAVVTVERLRAADPTTGIFFVASDSNPDAILRSMRAGATIGTTALGHGRAASVELAYEQRIVTADGVTLPEPAPSGLPNDVFQALTALPIEVRAAAFTMRGPS